MKRLREKRKLQSETDLKGCNNNNNNLPIYIAHIYMC